MDYDEAVEYLGTKVIFGIKPGLERIAALCGALKNPQESYPAIQITGTNGKTSVTRMTSAILNRHGIKTGTYTSPHLEYYTERFGIDGQEISKEKFAGYLENIIPQVEKISSEGEEPLTHFEILTGLAFYIFAQEDIECAVLEVGLGGRWDATSIVTPEVSVITNVSLEHTDRLGETIAEIAFEKSCIIKENAKAIIGKLSEEALQVVTKRSDEVDAESKIMGKDFSCSDVSETESGIQRLTIQGLYEEYTDVSLKAFGRHQGENLCLAVVSAEAYLGKPLVKEKIEKVSEGIDFPGRLEVVSQNPLVMLDGAHNPAGVDILLKSLDTEFAGKNRIMVLGILEDKDSQKMLEKLVSNSKVTVFSQNTNERCTPADDLAEVVKGSESVHIVEPDLKRAIKIAVEKATEDDIVLITGSLYTVGEARTYLKSPAFKSLEDN